MGLELGRDPDEVIAMTHGKRAIDNLKALKPWIRSHEMDDAVVAFEKTILDYADGRRTPSISSRRGSRSAGSRRASSSAGASGRKLSQGSLGGVSPFGLSQGLSKLSDVNAASKDTSAFDEDGDSSSDELDKDLANALQEEEFAFDGAIRILPGVRRIIDSIPEGKYAVATSSARTYAYGAMERVGIIPPKVTITAEHPELTHGKPHPAPFLLSAKKLGFPAEKCLVIEDSPSGIKAGVASGAVTIAVCTSHTYDKICNLGAQYVVWSLDQVSVEHQEDGRLKVVIEHPSEAVERMNAGEVCEGLLPEEVDAAIAKFKEMDLAKKEMKKHAVDNGAPAAASKQAAIGDTTLSPSASMKTPLASQAPFSGSVVQTAA